MQFQEVAVVIPARLNSQRLFQKSLLKISGRSLILRVLDSVVAAGASRIIVATDSEKIQKLVRKEGHEAYLSASSCRSGSDRVAEIARRLKEKIIVNVQGDELFLSSPILRQVITLIEEGAEMASCMHPFREEKDYRSPHQVKVLCNAKMEAIYFTRYPLFLPKENPMNLDLSFIFQNPYLGKHMGVYSYTRDFLLKFASLDSPPLEKKESLEQLRAIHFAYPIKMAMLDAESFGINVEEDISFAQKRLKTAHIEEK